MLRAGPYRLSLEQLENAPHGIDLGPLKPRLPDALRTTSGRIELAPEPIVADVDRLRGVLGRGNGHMVRQWAGAPRGQEEGRRAFLAGRQILPLRFRVHHQQIDRPARVVTNAV